MKFLYLAKATLPTADGDDLETVCGVPDYCHYLLEKLLLAEAMIIDNDDRRDNLLIEIERIVETKSHKCRHETPRINLQIQTMERRTTTFRSIL